LGVEFVPLLVAGIDLAVDAAALAADALPLKVRRGRAYVGRGLTVNALRFKGPVIDVGLVPEAFKVAVGDMLPSFAPFLQVTLAVVLPHFLSKPFRAYMAHGQENVRVMISLIAFRARGVNGNIGNHAVPDEVFPHKILDQPFTLLVGQFVRQRYFDFPGKL